MRTTLHRLKFAFVVPVLFMLSFLGGAAFGEHAGVATKVSQYDAAKEVPAHDVVLHAFAALERHLPGFDLITPAMAEDVPAPTPSATAQPDGIDKAASALDGVTAWLEAHKDTILKLLGFLGTFLFMKLFPNSKAGPLVSKLQGAWDKIFKLVPGIGKLISLVFELLYAVVKSDGIGGKK